MVTEAESHQWILADRMENLGDPADGLQEGLLLDGEEADHVNNIVYHHGEEGEGEGGAEPPEVVVEQGAHRRRRANIAEWANEELDVDMRPFTAVAGPRLPPDHAFADPLSVFDLFWEDLRDLFVRNTNRYAHRLLSNLNAPAYLRPWKEVCNAEMDVFMALIILMGIKELPSDEMYWQKDKWGDPTVSNSMSRTRFLQIKRCLSVALPTDEENRQDKLAKCRSAVTAFLAKAKDVYVPNQNLSLDESQILCCGRNARCAHRGDKHNAKPLKDYVKSFGLHESATGYCVNFAIDERNATTTREYVHRLVEPLVEHQQPYCVVTDRYYTSVDTARSLQERGVFMFGTLRRDRGCPKTLLDDIKQHPLANGEYRWQMAPSVPAPLSVFAWHDSDKNGTLFLSTCHKPTDTVMVRRRVRGAPTVQKPAPKVASDYNQHMGFCDSANHMKRNYAIQLTHHHRWYMCVIYYVLEMAILNSFIIWRSVSGQPNLAHLTFRDSLIDSLLGRSSAHHGGSLASPPAKRQRLDPAKLPERRLSQEQHLVDTCLPPKNCKWCYAVHKRQNKASFQCTTCGVPLHSRECFRLYHTVHGHP